MPNRPPADAISRWLLICCGMVFVMALLGAVTRLTQAGLSITQWDPVIGAIPPLTERDWQRAFASYQAIPQYQIWPGGMTLEAFKTIFFWEWLHRLWGRLIGIVFAVPLLVFWVRGLIDRGLGLRLTAIFLLGGLQGFIGWFMVQSGLETRTSVSPYRLALHLGFAVLIYSLLLGLVWSQRPTAPLAPHVRRHGWLALILLITTMLWGALVAGLQAGSVYNTWPLMAGDVVPAGAFVMHPTWLNVLENAGLVQFIHRWLGPLTMIVIVTWAGRCGTRETSGRAIWAALAGMAVLQVSLGLATLLSHVQIAIAVLHQAGAITLLSLLLYSLITTRHTSKSTQTETARPHRQNANTTPPPSARNEHSG